MMPKALNDTKASKIQSVLQDFPEEFIKSFKQNKIREI